MTWTTARAVGRCGSAAIYASAFIVCKGQINRSLPEPYGAYLDLLDDALALAEVSRRGSLPSNLSSAPSPTWATTGADRLSESDQ